MADSYSFAVDVFRCVGERQSGRAAELELLAGTAAFHGWLVGEAFLACKGRQVSYPFCEVAAKATYASEGVGGEGVQDAGDLRVGGPDDGANHCWLFAEFVVVGDGAGGGWKPMVMASIDRLKGLGWKRSAAPLIVVAASRGEVPTKRAHCLACNAVRNWSVLTDPFVIALPGGGTVIMKASRSSSTK